MNATIVLHMAKLANEILCSEDSEVDGLVITHGTDTLEETAYFSAWSRSFSGYELISPYSGRHRELPETGGTRRRNEAFYRHLSW